MGILILLFYCFGQVMAQSNPETYPVDPASEEQAGVPEGEILKFTFREVAAQAKLPMFFKAVKISHVSL